MADSPLLHVDSIRYEKGITKILNSVFLALQQGEILGLLGRNGSGKSTLLKIIFGTVKPDYGYMALSGNHFRYGYQTKEIAMSPQEGFLPLNNRLDKLLSLFQVSMDIFKNTSLKTEASKKINQFSTGERRFIEVLILLHSDYRVVLLDEPFQGLSPIMIEELAEQIKKSSRGKGIIITDHKYKTVQEISARIILLKNGNLHNIDSNQDLIEHHYIKD